MTCRSSWGVYVAPLFPKFSQYSSQAGAKISYLLVLFMGLKNGKYNSLNRADNSFKLFEIYSVETNKTAMNSSALKIFGRNMPYCRTCASFGKTVLVCVFFPYLS